MSRLPCTLFLALAATLAAAQDHTAPAAVAAAPESKPATRPAESRPSHPRIGVGCDPVMLDTGGVAKVTKVAPGSPAEAAGIKVGDIVMKVGTDVVNSDAAWRTALGMKKVGDKLVVRVKRGGDEMNVDVTLTEWRRPEPDVVTVQHCLVAFKGASRADPTVTRTLEEARKLADEIATKCKNGADFDAFVKQYSSDPGSVAKTPPGMYAMSNFDVRVGGDVTGREGMVAGFGAVAFNLEVGDIGVTPYDATTSPFGFHVIKRIK